MCYSELNLRVNLVALRCHSCMVFYTTSLFSSRGNCVWFALIAIYYGDALTGFHNTNSQISASLTSNGKYVVSASEDSYVYVWRHEGESRPNRSKGVKVTRAYELFHCQDVSAAIPWPGLLPDPWNLQDNCGRVANGTNDRFEDLNEYHPTTPVGETNGSEGSPLPSGCSNSPLNGSLSSGANSYLFDRISVTWPEEKLVSATKNRVSVELLNGLQQSRSAWGMVIVSAGLRGEIKTFQNFGLPVRI